MSWRIGKYKDISCYFKIFNLFLMGSKSDEYEIHRRFVMCTAVYSELLSRSCEGSAVVRREEETKKKERRE